MIWPTFLVFAIRALAERSLASSGSATPKKRAALPAPCRASLLLRQSARRGLHCHCGARQSNAKRALHLLACLLAPLLCRRQCRQRRTESQHCRASRLFLAEPGNQRRRGAKRASCLAWLGDSAPCQSEGSTVSTKGHEHIAASLRFFSSSAQRRSAAATALALAEEARAKKRALIRARFASSSAVFCAVGGFERPKFEVMSLASYRYSTLQLASPSALLRLAWHGAESPSHAKALRFFLAHCHCRRQAKKREARRSARSQKQRREARQARGAKPKREK